jgi:hypothetical protein
MDFWYILVSPGANDFMKSYDAGLQTDVAILDFSKAFDTVPHNKLLHNLETFSQSRGSVPVSMDFWYILVSPGASCLAHSFNILFL